MNNELGTMMHQKKISQSLLGLIEQQKGKMQFSVHNHNMEFQEFVEDPPTH